MNEKTKLLQRATLDFTVKNIACYCYNAKRILTKNGFVYILVDKKENKKIDNITIHNNTRRDINEFGNFDIGELVIQTQVNLLDIFKEHTDDADTVFLMKMADDDLYFSVYNLIAYNKEMKNYDYRAELLQNKNKSFVVYDITEITDDLINFKSILNDNQKGLGITSNKCQAEFDINYIIETERLYKSEELIKELIIQLNIDNNTITMPIFNLNEL